MLSPFKVITWHIIIILIIILIIPAIKFYDICNRKYLYNKYSFNYLEDKIINNITISKPDILCDSHNLAQNLEAVMNKLGKPDKYELDTIADAYAYHYHFMNIGLIIRSYKPPKISEFIVKFDENTIKRIKFNNNIFLDKIPSVEFIITMYGQPDEINNKRMTYINDKNRFIFYFCNELISELYIGSYKL